ncbi:UBA-like domain-containing protein [Phthorimaea operculella]|nr:UBA-like domain-containing protein [Phthorimaea operculella]
MDLEDNAMGLTPEQTDKILQFQDLTGIEDMSICRDVLQRHQWDLEVAIQEQLNIREGRPSVFATEARMPAVVHDHIAQQVFTDEPAEGPGGVRGLISYVVNLVVSMCYNTLSSILNLLLSFVRNDDRRLVTDPLGDVMGFIENYTSRFSPHPVFYQGTYAQALNDAKNELRFLIVYLHSESASETQSFCRNTLADPDVIAYINTHALFWGCSIDSSEGWRVAQSVGGRRYPLLCVVCVREHRMTVVARSEGSCDPRTLLSRLRRVVQDNEPHLAMARADSIDSSEGRYPLLCVVCVREHRMTVVARSEGSCDPRTLLSRLRRVVQDNEPHLAMARADSVVCVKEHRMTVVARSEGSCDRRTLLSRLRRVVQDNEPHLAMARADRVEREVTQRLRQSQDEAYAESLAADQEKERRRNAERAAQQQRENEELMRKQMEEKRKLEEKERRRNVERAAQQQRENEELMRKQMEEKRKLEVGIPMILSSVRYTWNDTRERDEGRGLRGVTSS